MEFKGNQKHLSQLKAGVDVWNAWYHENRHVAVNLEGAHLYKANLEGVILSEANLRGAYLDNANLRGAELRGTDLSGASLSGADLSRSNSAGIKLEGAHLYRASLEDAYLHGAKLDRSMLSEAILVGANLDEAHLHGVDLTEASMHETYLGKAKLINATLTGAKLLGAILRQSDLTGAKLIGADLTRVDLERANLSNASLSSANLSVAKLLETFLKKTYLGNVILDETVFANVDLSKTKGLEKCRCRGVSVIDHRTLAKSKDLPVGFLRGVGLSEDQIRAYLYGTSITIEFTEKGWGDLIPIEKALKATIGEGYEVLKSEDRIIVRLESPDLLNRTLDAVGAVLSALEAESPGDIRLIALQAPGRKQELLSQEERDFLLVEMSIRLNNEQKPGTLVEETGKGFLESSYNPVGPMILRWIEWFHARVQKPGKDEERLREIQARFKPAFKALREVKAIQNKPRTKLPPADEIFIRS